MASQKVQQVAQALHIALSLQSTFTNDDLMLTFKGQHEGKPSTARLGLLALAQVLCDTEDALCEGTLPQNKKSHVLVGEALRQNTSYPQPHGEAHAHKFWRDCLKGDGILPPYLQACCRGLDLTDLLAWAKPQLN